jgi:DNA-directed RNA polymerase specialized sigma24 family protein
MPEYRWQTAQRLRDQGMSWEEIGAAMGIAENTVGAMLRRASAPPRECSECERLKAENARLRRRLQLLELGDE